MYITKTLAVPRLDGSDCIKIVDLADHDAESVVCGVLRGLIRLGDFDITDDELLAHICIRAGMFTYKDWQILINEKLRAVSEIDYEVDSTKRRLNLIETVYQSSGSCGRVSAGGYKMISALTARDLVFSNMEAFEKHFGKNPGDYITELWEELDRLLGDGVIIGKYTDELHEIKRPRRNS